MHCHIHSCPYECGAASWHCPLAEGVVLGFMQGDDDDEEGDGEEYAEAGAGGDGGDDGEGGDDDAGEVRPHVPVAHRMPWHSMRRSSSLAPAAGRQHSNTLCDDWLFHGSSHHQAIELHRVSVH